MGQQRLPLVTTCSTLMIERTIYYYKHINERSWRIIHSCAWPLGRIMFDISKSLAFAHASTACGSAAVAATLAHSSPRQTYIETITIKTTTPLVQTNHNNIYKQIAVFAFRLIED